MNSCTVGSSEREVLARLAWKKDEVEVEAGGERPQYPEEPALRRAGTEVEETPET